MTEQLEHGFEPCLRRHSLEALRAHAGSVYALWPTLCLAYMNPAWFRFAAENGGEPAISTRWPLGAPVLDAMPEPVCDFYRSHYEACLASGEAWHHDYECSSDTVYRRFRQAVYPLEYGGGLLVVNSLAVERPQDVSECAAPRPRRLGYRDEDGRIHQCAHCRRTMYVDAIGRWDWVPAWVRAIPEGTVHTLCPVCHAHYYPPATVA